MSDWAAVFLKDVTAKIGSGATPTGGGEAYKESGISLVRSQNVLDFKFSVDGLAFIDEDQAYNLRSVTLEKDDVLLNITGDSVARCCMLPSNILPGRVNQHVAIIRADTKKSSPRFLHYNLLYQKDTLLSFSEIGATRRALTKRMLENCEISIPPLPEQEAIAEVLGSLDDKIDLLHRNNKTLEQLAETLFRQWFVEEDTELIRLGDVLKTTSGGTPSRAVTHYYTGNIPWIKSKELPNGFVLDTEEKITDEALKNSSAKKLPPFTVLIAMYGATVGEIGISTQVATCNQAIAAIPETKEYPFSFLFNFFKSIKDDLINLAVGAAQQNISQILIQELLIPIAGSKVNKYDKVVGPFYNKVLNNTQQIKKLETLRDTLLPKLMSGVVTLNKLNHHEKDNR